MPAHVLSGTFAAITFAGLIGVMGFDDFQRYLISDRVSPASGRALGEHAASDYASRLRRLERLLSARLADSPPKVLETLARELRHDPRLTASVSQRVIVDIAVAVRAYADYLARKDVESPPRDGDRIAEAVAALMREGFSRRQTEDPSIIELRRSNLTVYALVGPPWLLIVHPAFEAQYDEIRAVNGVISGPGLRFWHHAALRAFPRRDNGDGPVHYGIGLRVLTSSGAEALIAVLSRLEPEEAGADREAPETEAAILAKARLGQGRFRADLLDLWQGRCPLTEVSSPELLRASHIKAWRSSSNAERLDARNGLLLAVHLDALFDRSLITFTDQGEMIVAGRLPARDRAVFGLDAINRRLLLNLGHLGYLRHHREIFDRNDAAPTPPSPAGAACAPPTA